MSKKVRIELNFELFKNLLLTCGEHDEPALQELNKVLTDKLDRMVLREQYSTYKTSPDPEKREQARQQYLDGKGVREGFRWSDSDTNRDSL